MKSLSGETQTPTDIVTDDGTVFKVTVRQHHEFDKVIPLLKEALEHRVVLIVFELEEGRAANTKLCLEELIDLLCLPAVQLRLKFRKPIDELRDYRKSLSDLNYFINKINPYADPIGLERVKLAITKCMGELYELRSEKL